MAEFFSEEFFQQLATRLNEDEEWQKKGSDLTTKIVATCTDRDLSFLLDIQDGQVSASEVDAEEPADFKFEGPYASWQASAEGGKDLQTLVMTGRMKFKGSMSKIMAMMGPLSRLTGIIRDIPTEF